MKKYVKIINIIDKSGSMGSIIDSAISGFNEFIQGQKSVEGEAIVSTIMFSNLYKVLYENMDIKNCNYLDRTNYIPDGNTALYDAIGKTIESEINRLGTLPLEERPEKTLCVILTDGFENASRIFGKEKIKKMITEMKEDFKWEFIFLGANEEASLTAEAMGISKGNSYAFTATEDGIKDAYRGVNFASKVYRMSSDNRMEDVMTQYSSSKKDEESKK